MLGKPIAECDALCIPTALYGHPMAGPRQAWRCISGQETGTPTVGLGWKSVGVLELTAPRRGALGPAGPRDGRPARRGWRCRVPVPLDATERAGGPSAVAARDG